LVHLYFCMFLLFVYGVVAPRFCEIGYFYIFVFCRDSLSIVAYVSFVKLCYLQFCEVVAGFLGVVVGWVGLLFLLLRTSRTLFYICVSVHRSISQIKHQFDATLCRFYFCFISPYGDVMTYLQL